MHTEALRLAAEMAADMMRDGNVSMQDIATFSNRAVAMVNSFIAQQAQEREPKPAFIEALEAIP